MAKTLILKLALLSLTLLILALHFPRALSSSLDDDNDDQDYVVDSFFENSYGMRTRSRFLRTSGKKTIRKGASCDVKSNPHVCNGVSVNNGTGILYCCKKHCRNVLGDRNNCGQCGRKCSQWERCCGGVCTNVWNDGANCGKCNKKCSAGVKCEYGYCGYA